MMTTTPRHPDSLILASTSIYRANLLRRLGLEFTQYSPKADETPRPGESPDSLASRLALAKAQAVAHQHPHRWILGADQVCFWNSTLFGKPGTRRAAHQQLKELAGHTIEFHTAVTLMRVGVCEQILRASDLTRVRLRNLTNAEIERYLDEEPAIDCAGSFRSEGLGISLCEAIESNNPTALIGLPLISVRRLLGEAGIGVP